MDRQVRFLLVRKYKSRKTRNNAMDMQYAFSLMSAIKLSTRLAGILQIKDKGG
jgi:hypothetical protein